MTKGSPGGSNPDWEQVWLNAGNTTKLLLWRYGDLMACNNGPSTLNLKVLLTKLFPHHGFCRSPHLCCPPAGFGVTTMTSTSNLADSSSNSHLVDGGMEYGSPRFHIPYYHHYMVKLCWRLPGSQRTLNIGLCLPGLSSILHHYLIWLIKWWSVESPPLLSILVSTTYSHRSDDGTTNLIIDCQLRYCASSTYGDQAPILLPATTTLST